MLKIIILAWFVVSTALIFGLSNSTKSEFDPDMMLSQAMMSLDFEDKLSSELDAVLANYSIRENSNTNASSLISGNKGYLLNIVQGDCYCEWLSNRHQNNLRTWSKASNFNNLTINLDEFPFLKKYIPSTPALIAIDRHHDLIYLGPYSRGMGCFRATGEVDKILSTFINNTDNKTLVSTHKSKSAINEEELIDQQRFGIIESEAQGCYCST